MGLASTASHARVKNILLLLSPERQLSTNFWAARIWLLALLVFLFEIIRRPATSGGSLIEKFRGQTLDAGIELERLNETQLADRYGSERSRTRPKRNDFNSHPKLYHVDIEIICLASNGIRISLPFYLFLVRCFSLNLPSRSKQDEDRSNLFPPLVENESDEGTKAIFVEGEGDGGVNGSRGYSI